MKKCVIIGGGFAGLTSAVYLSQAGLKVELIEASKKLGGRAYSFLDKKNNSIIDNGQHIMMGCYFDTLKFIKKIDALDNLYIQDKLQVNFLDENFKLFKLSALKGIYPFNLLIALINYKAISFLERLKLLKFFIKLPFHLDKELKNLTVYGWLIKENQSKNVINSFWEILAVGSLNTNIKKASALTFSIVLRYIFLRGNKSASIILPKSGLTETYCNNAIEKIEQNGGVVSFSEQVIELINDKDQIKEIKTSKRVINDFDYIISAVPLFAAKKILQKQNLLNEFELEYSAILNIHIWLKDNKLIEKFYGLIDSPVHWVFNQNDHLTIVISDANDLIEMSKEEIFKMVSTELEKYLNIKHDEIIDYKIIKEKRSTFIPSKEILNIRPNQKTKFKNLFLAGDWVDTGFPSTIESAVKSGRIASELIIKK